MLKLEKINKYYKANNTNQHVLKNITISFRDKEFVSILGPSGSGKTTLLNIIGGLDKYDTGNLIINDKSTKSFTNKDFDAYRNSCIGFIFQNYNLISHLTIYENVEICMTLKGLKKKEKKKKTLKILEEVGLKDYINKYPNQLSGGQMQRVAIARALVNNPKIILADEPTGALDTKTSIQIMELIKRISSDKLVIMVTHNTNLANQYSSRIIELKDGVLINDSNPYDNNKNNENIFIKKTSMNFITALNISLKNILTKRGRTLITAFASSIGIIGLAIILALSNGMNKQINIFEQSTLANVPIMIEKEIVNLDETKQDNLKDYPNDEQIRANNKDYLNIHQNKITEEYLEYINKLDKNLYEGITYSRNFQINTLIKQDNNVLSIDLNNHFITLPINNDTTYITNNFDILKGKLPSNKNELLLVIDQKNSINKDILEKFNLNDKTNFDDILNLEIAIAVNNDYYEQINNYFKIKSNLNEVYNNSLKTKIVGIIRPKKEKELLMQDISGIVYTSELADYILNENNNSNIVNHQKKENYNVLTGTTFLNVEDKNKLISVLGENKIPNAIYIYPKDFASKNKIINYLDKYNENNTDKIIYSDQAKMFTDISSNIVNAITIILIAFSSVSLMISSIMIGIITYISVLERTKEIGILRSLGARKKDIKRVFTAETFIIGLISGVIGRTLVLITQSPINSLLYKLTSINDILIFTWQHALTLIIISTSLTMIGGIFPATIASNKNPVEALRIE